ncbi:hypothetical protein HDV00_010144 [Rhizophlyctis rosea]|nr:hypothetical protein HDV00_010144 [Rhizophlyctis rosea]
MTARIFPPSPSTSPATYTAFRIHPKADLKLSLQTLVKTHSFRAPFIQTAVGSLSSLHIRLAHDPTTKTNATLKLENQCFEIASLVGTLSPEGMHVHISVADKEGNMFGGHLLEGCTVFTTCEVVLGELQGLVFERELDDETGCLELGVKDRAGNV